MAGKTNMHLTYKTFPDVDFSALKFDGVRPGKSGMKFASLVGTNGRRLVCETPAMRIPWNTEIRKNEENGQCSCKIALSFQGMGDDAKDDGKLRRFYNFLNGVDQRVKELAVQNKGELWQKPMDEGKIEAYFQSSVKVSANDKYAPTFHGKIPLKEGKNPSSDDVNEAFDMKITVFRKDKTPVPPKELKGGCLASVIAEASYVWCTPMMIGISWVVKFVLVEPKVAETEFQFTDIEDFSDIKGVTDGTRGTDSTEGVKDEDSDSSDNKRKRESSGDGEEESDDESDQQDDEEEFS